MATITVKGKADQRQRKKSSENATIFGGINHQTDAGNPTLSALGTGCERIGDESLTQDDSVFVHG
ncbi:hypothetical protein G6N76_17120 [Rhizobium daejeonense]|uniref:Uncharacterized protein n=1 Tax=Rhizobium daejeonense TaxID=240521 RepID=A0A6M1RUK9_9HYPH|nr:hypothetical protein [Rhizobium daejeonense]NGO65394.1 hypothetical protein [Rhizobium daejeonense]